MVAGYHIETKLKELQDVNALSPTDGDALTYDDATGLWLSSAVVKKSLFDAHSILQATSDNTPVAITVGQQTVVGRITGGNITALTVAQLITLVLSAALPENVALILDSTMSADHKYSGIVVSGIAGYGTTAIGDLIYLASADGKWEKADADAEATTKPMLGIALEAVAEDASLKVLLYGYIRDDGFSLTNDGAPLFVGLTLGAMVEDVSGYTTGDCVRIVGYVHDASAHTVFFNPSGTWVEVA